MSSSSLSTPRVYSEAAKALKLAQRREARRRKRQEYENSEEGRIAAAEKAENARKRRRERNQRHRNRLRNIVIEDDSDLSQLPTPRYNLRSNAVLSDEEDDEEISSQATTITIASLESSLATSVIDISLTTPIMPPPASIQGATSDSINFVSPVASQVRQIPVTPRLSQTPVQRQRNCRSLREAAERTAREQEASVLSQINMIQPSDFFVNVAIEKLDYLHRNLEYYCFNSDFLQPVTETYTLLRQKQLFRLRFHRRGNDPENDSRYNHYKMRQVYPFIVDNFLNGNYPDLTMTTQLSQCVGNDIFAEECDEIDAEVMEDIYIRLCDPIRCPVLTENNILGFNEALQNLLKLLKERKYSQANDAIFETYENLRNLTLLDFIRVFYECYTGLRTVFNKINMLRGCLSVILATAPCSYNELPTFVKYSVCKEMEKKDVPADMTSHQVKRRFASEYSKFEAIESDLEIHVCEICARLTCKRYISKTDVNFNREWLPVSCQNENVIFACKQCKEDLRDRKKPSFALTNGFHVDPLPDSFKKLNFLEKNLIQLIHPIVGEYSVIDHRGVGTGMRGKNGTCTFHAVPLDSTTGLVATTLPDASNMKILVVSERQNFQPTLVDVENVVKCLMYLKRTNVFYRDITIDSQFQVNNDILQVNSNYNLCGNRRTESLLKPEDTYVSGTTMRQYGRIVRSDTTAPTNYQKYIMKQHAYEPLKYDHKDLDVKCVPWLLPTGRFGWDYERESEVSFILYNRARLRNENRQFATDPLYVLLVAGIIEQQQLQSSISLALRQSKMKFTCGDVLRLINSNRFEDHVLFSSMLSDIRGYAPYWANVKKLLRAHVQVFGSPTWWLTFNPDLRRFNKLHETYSKLTGKDVNESNIYEHVAKDPLLFQRFFHRRLRAIWKFIHSDSKPIGEAVHSFKRIEYQLGGLNHAHCFVWIKDAPSKSSPPEEVCAFLDKYVTAKRPCATEDAFLADLVEECQMHDYPCRDTCKRDVVIDGKTVTTCRFDFPRETVGKTYLRSEFGSYASKTRRLYSLARAQNEQHVNDYNVPLLTFWNANMDIQFLVDGVPTVINYAVDYVNKDDGFKNSLFENKLHEPIQSKDLFQLGVDLMKRKKMPPTEAIDIIMGENLYEFDAKHIFINLHADPDRKRIVVADKLLNTLPANSRAYCENAIDDYYPLRPNELENTCLFSYMIAFGIEYYTKGADGTSNTRVPAKNSRGRRSDDFIEIDGSIMDDTYSEGVYYGSKYHVGDPLSPFYDYRHLPKGHVMKLRNGGKEIVKLARMLVPDIYLKAFKPGNDAEREDFYRRICMAFIPFRNEASLKSFFANQSRPYETRWIDYFENLKITSENAYNDIKRYLDQHLAYFEEERKIFDQRPKESNKRSTNNDSQFDYTLNFDRGDIDENELHQQVDNLKPDQRNCFDKIINHFEQQSDIPLRIFLSGPGGYGKSILLDVLDKYLTLKHTPLIEERKNTPAVVKCATTGAAAKNINGFTIHSLLGIGVDAYNLLNDSRRDALRNQLQKVKLIMIDEISMASNELLAMISLRLQEITERNLWFGGISVLMSGDLLQLPPVKGKFCFEVLNAVSLKKLIECAADEYDLWNSMDIEYMELTENKRQSVDHEYGEVLARLRVGKVTDDDIEYLSERIVTITEGIDGVINLYRDLSLSDKTVVILYSTNDEVDTLNNRYLLTHFKDSLVVIYALKCESVEDGNDGDVDVDTNIEEITTTRKFTRIYQESRYKLTRQPRGSYAQRNNKASNVDKAIKKLVVAPGVRVMLTKNIDLKRKLVNGSMGNVVRIIYDRENDTKVLEIEVKFDDVPDNVSITRTTITLEKPYAAKKRIQHFPLKVAFACTIHVTQGKTLSSAIVSLERVFAPGQAYVALSRLKSISGLYLLNCPRRVFFCDAAALEMQNKLRNSIGLPSFETSVTFLQRPYARVECLPITRVATMRTVAPVVPCGTLSTNQRVPEESPLDVLLLVNRGNDCFLIAVVNMIYFATELTESIISHVDISSDIQIQLVQILRKDVNNARNLRQVIPQIAVTGNHGAMQEAAGFAMLLIQGALEHSSTILFTLNYNVFVTCLCDSGQPRLVRGESSAGSVTFGVSNDVNFLNDIKDDWFNEIHTPCPDCQSIRRKRYELQIRDEQKYLYVEVNAFTAHDNNIKQILLGDADIDNFHFGVSWKLIGMVQHLGGRSCGHYKAWRRVRDYWIIANDEVLEQSSAPLSDMSRFNILLFERNI